jgi:hypothetical protein
VRGTEADVVNVWGKGGTLAEALEFRSSLAGDGSDRTLARVVNVRKILFGTFQSAF